MSGRRFQSGWGTYFVMMTDAAIHIKSCPRPSWTAPHGDQLRHAEVLKLKNGKMVCRVHDSDGESMILKLWEPQASRLGQALRRMTGRTPLRREAVMLRYLGDHGVRVPRVLGYGRLDAAFSPYVAGIAIEDWGPQSTGLAYLKSLLRSGRFESADRFEQQVIELTASFLQLGVIDVDHRLNNMLVSEDGEPRRIDLELAKRRWSVTAARPLGQMLGHLLTTYIFAVQPDLSRFRPFASRLVERIRPRRAALRHAEVAVREELARQRHTVGVDSRVEFPW